MARYIDADALIKKIFPLGMVDGGNYAINAKAIVNAIDRLPTADVVEVVRCKDCKRCFINKFGEESNVGVCNKRGVIGTIVQLDDFCSYGERSDT